MKWRGSGALRHFNRMLLHSTRRCVIGGGFESERGIDRL